jgi:hypothetical protein
MTIKQPFSPQYGSNQVLTAGATSAKVNINKDSKQVRVVNTGANKGYIRIYDSSNDDPAATTADCPVAAGAAVVVTKGGNQDSIAYISATGTTLEVMTGEGF